MLPEQKKNQPEPKHLIVSILTKRGWLTQRPSPDPFGFFVVSSVPEVLKLHVVLRAELTGLDDAVKLTEVLVLKSHRCFPLKIRDTF